MSGNSFNDFTALKALKRELERADAAASGAKSAEAASSAESAGADSGAQAPSLRPGMRVTLMDSNDRGVVRHVRKDWIVYQKVCPSK